MWPAFIASMFLGAPTVLQPDATTVLHADPMPSSLGRLAIVRSMNEELDSHVQALPCKEMMQHYSVSSSDPIWSEFRTNISALIIAGVPASQQQVNSVGRRCREEASTGAPSSELTAAYTATMCATGSDGQKPYVDPATGAMFKTDAIYCGNARIDWTNITGDASRPAIDVCHAPEGSAYSPDGICGHLSDKELVLSMCEIVPLWANDLKWMNLPNIGCLLGVANCDIAQCKLCEGLCS